MRQLMAAFSALFVWQVSASAGLPPSPKGVLAHHISVVKKDDVAGIMQDYADNSVVVIGKNIYIGAASIHKFFEGLAAQHRDWNSYVVNQEVAEHGVVLQKVVATGNVEVFVVRDGKIAFQTTAFQP